MAKLDAAGGQLERGNAFAAAGQLGAFLHELEAFVSSERLTTGQATPLRAYAQRIIASATTAATEP